MLVNKIRHNIVYRIFRYQNKKSVYIYIYSIIPLLVLIHILNIQLFILNILIIYDFKITFIFLITNTDRLCQATYIEKLLVQ